MTDRTFTKENGTYIFRDSRWVIEARRLRYDTQGRRLADLHVLSPDGQAYLGRDEGPLSSGDMLFRLARQTASRNSGDVDGVANGLLDVILSLEKYLDSTAIQVPASKSAADFFAEQETTEYVIDQLIEAGGLYGVVGAPKSGKTLLTEDMATNVAGTRRPNAYTPPQNIFVGRNVVPGRVHLWQLEDPPRVTRLRLKTMCSLYETVNMRITTEGMSLSEENFDQMLAAIQGTALLVVDPMIQVLTSVKNWDSPTEVRPALDLWRRLARAANTAIVMVAHHRKSGGQYGEGLAGSVQFLATMDGIIEIFRDPKLEDSERRVSFTGRNWANLGDEVISLDQPNLTWLPLGNYNEVVRDREYQNEAAKTQQSQNSLLTALPKAPPGKTFFELASATGWGRPRVEREVAALGDKVRQVGGGTRGDPYRFWVGGIT